MEYIKVEYLLLMEGMWFTEKMYRWKFQGMVTYTTFGVLEDFSSANKYRFLVTCKCSTQYCIQF